MRHVGRLALAASAALLLICGCAGRRVKEPASWAYTTKQGLTLRVGRDPFYFEATDPTGVLLRTAPVDEDGTGSIAFRVNGEWDPVVKVIRADYPLMHPIEDPAARTRGEISLLVELKSGTRAGLKFTSEAPDVIRILGQVFPYHAADAFACYFQTDPSEHFYGFGDVWNGSLDQQGKTVRMWVQTGTPDECCYVPFFVSTRRYGLLVSDYHDGTFDMAASRPDRFSFRFESASFDVRFFYGPTPREVVRKYTAAAGRPPLPPRWVFTPWKWRNKVDSDAEVYEDAHGFRDNDIPCGVIFIDNPWMEYGINSFLFDPKRFPNPQKMIDDLHEMGYRLLVWACPWTRKDVPNWREGAEGGYFVLDASGQIYMDGDASYVDFTNPQARLWWQSQINKVLDMGIDGFKLDRGQKIPVETLFYDGSTGAEMHNKYALYFVGTYYEACYKKRGDDFTLLPRAGCLQSQRFSPSKWPGDCTQDFDEKRGMPPNVIAMLSAGLCGFSFWGSDVGGFQDGDLTKTVLLRWLEYGAFSPIMQVGGGAPREPWDRDRFDDETLEIYRYWSWMRQEMIPYIYSYAHVSAEEGQPIARPLFYSFPSDEGGFTRKCEYMFGDWLLVAPIMNYEGVRDVYLPPGTWIDYWSDELHQGPKLLKGYALPLSKMPLFVRAGALIPLEVERSYCGHGSRKSAGHVTVLAYPQGEGKFHLRDGDVDALLAMRREGAVVVISWETLPRPLILRVMCDEPSAVELSGRSLPRVESEETLFDEGAAWCYDAAARRCIVRVCAAQSGQVRIVP